MEVETFRLPSAPVDGYEPRQKCQEGAAYRSLIAAELGLKAQATMAASTLEDAAMFYEQLNWHEYLIWTDFLLRAYSRVRGEWADYIHDVVPTEALEQISTAVSLQLFDDLEIWTPEGHTDPVVVGTVGIRQHAIDHNGIRRTSRAVKGSDETPPETKLPLFLVCRWGESLASLEEIRQGLLNQHQRTNLYGHRKVGPPWWLEQATA